jgi:hypothetical protein
MLVARTLKKNFELRRPGPYKETCVFLRRLHHINSCLNGNFLLQAVLIHLPPSTYAA